MIGQGRQAEAAEQAGTAVELLSAAFLANPDLHREEMRRIYDDYVSFARESRPTAASSWAAALPLSSAASRP